MSFDNYRAVHPSLWDDDDEPQEEVTEREDLKGKQSWQVSPLKGNNQGYYRVITLWGEILSAIDKWQKLEETLLRHL